MNVKDVAALLELPFPELIYRAQSVHRSHHDPAALQLSTLLSVKTGGCPEDCAYCPQSRRYRTGVEDEDVLSLETVTRAARAARSHGASRFCMGAAWRGPKDKDLNAVLEMVRAVKTLGLETCATLGMLKPGQAERLREAGLDYYNHNLDTSPEFYGQIITTREYRGDRAGLIAQLASLDPYPESVPINALVAVAGTPLAQAEELDALEFVRTVAAARITMPKAWVRLSAGRERMSDAVQALCFLAGANSVFFGEKLLTTGNPEAARDRALFARLGLKTAG